MRSAAGVKCQVHIHSPVPDAGQIQRNAHRRAATAAGACPEVRNRQGISELIGIGGYRGASADQWAAALEFVYCQVYAFAEEHLESTFHAVVADKAFEVAVRTPGELEQRMIRASAIHEDRSSHEIEKIDFALLEPPTKDRSGLRKGEGISKVGRKSAKQPEGHDQIAQQRLHECFVQRHSPQSSDP